MKLLCVLSLLLLSLIGQANNYYFSSQSGDDTRSSVQAQNQLTPWKTLAKLNSFFTSLVPGDSVLFKRGETFEGFIISAASGTATRPITFAAFGSGAKPVISGSTILNNWVSAGGNTWQTTNSSLTDSVNILTLNGVSYAKGRFPNAGSTNNGYLIYESHIGNTNITDNQLTAVSGQNWTGADIVIRKTRHIIDRGRITQQNGNSISYTGTSVYDADDSSGYFIQNHPATLDQRGEWCHDKSLKKITLYLNGGENPNSQVIRASYINTILQVWNRSYLHFNDLNFESANEIGIDLFANTNLQFNRCILSNMGTAAMSGLRNTSTLIDSCQILNSNNNGLYFLEENGNTVSNSIFRRTAMFSGMGKNGDDTYQSIILRGDNMNILNNVVDSSGYNAIQFEGDFIQVKNNFVENFNLVKDDGGGIYTWTGDPSVVYHGGKVTDNIVINGTGAGLGTPEPLALFTQGIYIDETAGFIDVTGNSVANCNGGGIYLHNTNTVSVTNNTSFNNGSQLLMDENHGYTLRQSSIMSNLFFSKYNTQPVAHLLTDANDFSLFGAFNNNYYCRPIDDNFVIETNFGGSANGYAIYTLAGWQNTSGFDLNSKITGTQIPPYAISAISSTNKFSNPSFTANIDSVYTYSPINISHITWTNGEKLDGGALKVSFDGANDSATNNAVNYVIMHVGAVSASKQYILRFSLQGTKNLKNMRVYLRKEGSPYNQLLNPQFCTLLTTRTENEFQLMFPESQSSASIIFEVTKDAGDFYVDNVRLSEATINSTNADDYIRYEYNASGNSRSVDLNGIQYVDAKNTPYSGSLTLAPWSSVVLIKTTMQALPVKYSQFTGRLLQKNVLLSWSTTPPPAGSHFEIEHSQRVSFAKIGSVEATPDIATYGFTDPAPLPGKNYYRIKEIDPDGVVTYSSVILVNVNTADKTLVWPNPASDRINIDLPAAMTGKKVTLSLQSVAGAVLVKKELTVSGEPIVLDISTYTRGVYLVRIDEGDQVFTSTFIKQ